ncbi:hypothetical protein MPLB_1710016 [Mesorhizobium sp. ORS 3324]|nr:hypothetical protein MPLB_1710016 [Mesorhizobium sp. ORS 3324]
MTCQHLAKEHAPRAAVFDRRALLQRTRRSPIRPRRSRVEASARTVSPAKPGRGEATERVRVVMAVLLQEQPSGGKCRPGRAKPEALPRTRQMRHTRLRRT